LGFAPNVFRSVGGALALVAYDGFKSLMETWWYSCQSKIPMQSFCSWSVYELSKLQPLKINFQS
jgi:hypothetical protein